MKKTFTFLLAVFFLVAIGNLKAQQIPNHDFENWAAGEPDDWGTSNADVMVAQFTTVTQDTITPYSGLSAAKVETVTENIIMVGDVTLPGILTLGDFILDIANQTGYVDGGIPFPHRPIRLNGYYKYQPTSGDQATIGIGLSKWNGTQRDTIGSGTLFIPTSATSWTHFEVDISWTSTDAPDSMNIVISSSNIIGASFQTGSTIWIDSLYFEYESTSAPLSNFESINIKQYPNPFSDKTQIKFVTPYGSEFLFEVYTVTGQRVYSREINAHAGTNLITFYANKFPSGLYIYKLSSNTTIHKSFMQIIK